MPDLVDNKGAILKTGHFKHIALADPKLAPYGVAAMDVIKNLGLSDKLQPLLVQGENIAQTHQFISTGNAELGFIALSQVIDNGKIDSGSSWIVPDNLHPPIKQAAISEQVLEAAATLRASPLDRFFSVALPMGKSGLMTATILGFTDTVGKFGVVLIVGGNIPDKTRVVSMQIYNQVEALEYGQAHWLAGCLLLFAFSVLLLLYTQPVAHPLK